MIHGLMWFPLLGIFIGLAYAGWTDYQRLEAYKLWAVNFERAKFDVRSVLGQRGRELTWGKPTRQGPVDLQTISLDAIQTVQVRLDREVIDPLAIAPETLENNPYPNKKSISLELFLTGGNGVGDRAGEEDGRSPVSIPFTDSVLALRWGQALQKLMVSD